MKSQKIIIEIILFLIGLLALYFGVYKGATLVLNSGEILANEQSSLARWENRQNIVQALSEKVKETTFKEELHLAMPKSENSAQFLKSIQGAAQSSGVAIKNFSISDSSSLSPSTSATSSDDIQPAELASYIVDLTAVSNYQNIYKFMNNLEKIKKVAQVNQINISKTGDNSLTVNLNLVVYYIK